VAVTGGFLVFPLLPSRPNHPCRHPSIRTLDERLLSSVQVGCSRCSRCCHLLVDLSSISNTEVGPGHRRSHRNSALGLGACNSMNLNYAAAGGGGKRGAIRFHKSSEISAATMARHLRLAESFSSSLCGDPYSKATSLLTIVIVCGKAMPRCRKGHPKVLSGDYFSPNVRIGPPISSSLLVSRSAIRTKRHVR
jgi:hypothetical protein